MGRELRIHLTGGVRCDGAGRRIEGSQFPGRLGRLAFAYLVAERDRPVPREELAEMLWAGAPPATWEKGTAVLVGKLRTLHADVSDDHQEHLSFAYGCYQLCLPEAAWIDISAASQATVDGESALAEGNFDAAVHKATAALGIARNDFLPGEEGAWVQRRRDDLQRLRLRSLDTIAQAQIKRGDPRSAVRAAKEAVTLEPYRESGYVLLMRAHAAAGDRAEALRVHEDCKRLLPDDLGVDPSPATEAVHLAILRSTLPTEATPVSPPTRQMALPVPTALARGSAAERRVSERRIATILFADLVGSATIGQGADPERARSLLESFLRAMADELERTGGTVENFVGDTVVAVFGAPASQEDHPERALHAALGMQRRLATDFGDRQSTLRTPLAYVSLVGLEPTGSDRRHVGIEIVDETYRPAFGDAPVDTVCEPDVVSARVRGGSGPSSSRWTAARHGSTAIRSSAGRSNA